MLEMLALKLITSLTGFMFEGYLDTFKYSKIDGAPSWYGQSGSSSMLVGYGYSKGGIETIDNAKFTCKKDIENKISKMVEISIYDNFKSAKDPKEIAFLKHLQADTQLKVFIDKNTKFEKIEHLKEKKESLFSDGRKYDETFAGCMIEKDIVIDYQKSRMKEITKELSQFRMESGVDELEAELEKI